MTDYARQEHREFVAASRAALSDGKLQLALVRLTSTLTAANRRGYDSLPESDQVREQARQIKLHTLANLPRYLEELEESVRSVGGFVHWADDAKQACAIICDIAWSHGVKRAVKAKSMTTEEIHLNAALEGAGIEVTETDFGEFVIQLAKERPSHIVAPAVHHTRESIAQLLSDHLGESVPDDAPTLAKTGRRILRQKFFAADMGITGVNFAVAETGTLVLVTNEGNGRLTTTWPRVHVAVMGMEKVIPRWRDLPVFLKLLARAATGHPLSVYTSLITGPAREGDLDGPEELHLVILDNGRSDVLASPFRESLACIRCGACLNACPVYRRIGGHAYGGIYSGPIGSVLTPLYDDISHNRHLPHASSLCGACQAACPIKINIPHMLIGLRELQHEKKRNFWEDLAYGMSRRVLQRPWLYRLMGRLLRWTLRPLSRDGWCSRLPGPVAAWTQSRDFPAPARRSFRQLWKREKKR
jgi:L-lactate dehydrogenase complex protein LldF